MLDNLTDACPPASSRIFIQSLPLNFWGHICSLVQLIYQLIHNSDKIPQVFNVFLHPEIVRNMLFLYSRVDVIVSLVLYELSFPVFLPLGLHKYP